MTTKCRKKPPNLAPGAGYGAAGGLSAISVEGPPLSPIVNVIPYAYVNNKILFLFQFIWNHNI